MCALSDTHESWATKLVIHRIPLSVKIHQSGQSDPWVSLSVDPRPRQTHHEVWKINNYHYYSPIPACGGLRRWRGRESISLPASGSPFFWGTQACKLGMTSPRPRTASCHTPPWHLTFFNTSKLKAKNVLQHKTEPAAINIEMPVIVSQYYHR